MSPIKRKSVASESLLSTLWELFSHLDLYVPNTRIQLRRYCLLRLMHDRLRLLFMEDEAGFNNYCIRLRLLSTSSTVICSSIAPSIKSLHALLIIPIYDCIPPSPASFLRDSIFDCIVRLSRGVRRSAWIKRRWGVDETGSRYRMMWMRLWRVGGWYGIRGKRIKRSFGSHASISCTNNDGLPTPVLRAATLLCSPSCLQRP